MNSSQERNTGVSTLGVLQIVFIVLKLCNLINWRWAVVLIPTWISLGIFVILLLCAVVALLWERYH